MGERERALDVMRRCVHREREYPNVQTEAALEFAFTVASLAAREHFEEARKALLEVEAREADVFFPLLRLKLHASKALLTDSPALAAQEAAAALRESERSDSGLRYHKSLGLVGKEFNALRTRLRVLLGS